MHSSLRALNDPNEYCTITAHENKPVQWNRTVTESFEFTIINAALK